MSDAPLLRPDFDRAYWRARSRLRFRDHPEFSRQRGHFEPLDLSSHAARFAEELTRAAAAEEMHRIAENAVTVLGLRRSRMTRTGRTLETPLFRCETFAVQDPEDPTRIVVSRLTHVTAELSALPPAFDELFPWKATELVVPIEGAFSRLELLERLEDWEELLGGRLTESADQRLLTLRLPQGLAIEVDLAAHEAAFSETRVEGVLAISGAVSRALKALPVRKRLFEA